MPLSSWLGPVSSAPERVGARSPWFSTHLAGCPGATSGCGGCKACPTGHVGEGPGDAYYQASDPNKPKPAGPNKTQLMSLTLGAQQLVDQVSSVQASLEEGSDPAGVALLNSLHARAVGLVAAAKTLESIYPATSGYFALVAERGSIAASLNQLLADAETSDPNAPPPPAPAPKPKAPAPKAPAPAPVPAPIVTAPTSSLEHASFGTMLRKVPTTVWAAVGAVLAVAGVAFVGKR